MVDVEPAYGPCPVTAALAWSTRRCKDAVQEPAAAAVRELAVQLERISSLDSHRLVAEEPFEGWWSASGKRNFVFWHALAWETDRHGFAWQSGYSCFIVASNDLVARTT